MNGNHTADADFAAAVYVLRREKDSNMRAFFTCEISADMLLSFLWVQMFFVGEHAEREISERFREILRSKREGGSGSFAESIGGKASDREEGIDRAGGRRACGHQQKFLL